MTKATTNPRDLMLRIYGRVKIGPFDANELSAYFKTLPCTIRDNLRMLHRHEMIYIAAWRGEGLNQLAVWAARTSPHQKDAPTLACVMQRTLGRTRSSGKRSADAAAEQMAAVEAKRQEEWQASVAKLAEEQAATAKKLLAQTKVRGREALRQARLQVLVPPEMRKTQWAFPIDFGART